MSGPQRSSFRHMAFSTSLEYPGDYDVFPPYRYPWNPVSKPLLNVHGQSAFGGLSGWMIKPVALRCVAQIAQTTKLPISGIGGISCWQDAVEFMLLGASTVQVCYAVMENGHGIIRDFCSGLQTYLERKEMASPAELVGRSLPYFTAHKTLQRDPEVFTAVDRMSCRRCGACVTACRDSGYQATQMDAEGFPVVNAARCDGCGLCAQICPCGSMTIVHTA